MKSVLDSVEKIVGKAQSAGNQHFLLLSQCFSEGLYLKKLLKFGIVW